ncbi:hypothetical protein E3N88_16677 [Mikania micrantha]|uniref:Uncharacterized protein n=1 Tax=Mikania micrantha TaxID=192012 RepID=A0A5N6P0B3_9ASTR|nr:hypothetical protein E3N88_16676 [Mikania micrantha]KAD5508974.1 hypothetical protein E3N88_16677 [Mikania micrantha]
MARGLDAKGQAAYIDLKITGSEAPSSFADKEKSTAISNDLKTILKQNASAAHAWMALENIFQDIQSS